MRSSTDRPETREQGDPSVTKTFLTSAAAIAVVAAGMSGAAFAQDQQRVERRENVRQRSTRARRPFQLARTREVLEPLLARDLNRHDLSFLHESREQLAH